MSVDRLAWTCLRQRRQPFLGIGVFAVVLQLGSNDLTDDRCTVNRFVAEYWGYIQYIRKRYLVRRVVVLEILHRQESDRYPMNMTVAEYNRKVDSANSALKTRCARSINVIFWQHNRHVRLPAAISSDGVHMHANAMKHYWRSVRGAVMRVVRAVLTRRGVNP